MQISFSFLTELVVKSKEMKLAIIWIVSLSVAFAQQPRSVTCVFGLTVHGYSCSIVQTNLQNVDSINIVLGNHQQDRNNASVIGFSMPSSSLNFFPLQVFELFQNLESIVFSRSRIPVLESHVFANRHILRSVDIRDSNINSIQTGAFMNLVNLNSLFLSLNPISSLPRSIFDTLTSLRTLELFSTGISRLEANLFLNTRALNIINLQFNQIRHIDRNIFDSTQQLQELQLTGNPCGAGENLNFQNILNGDLSNILPQLSRCFGATPISCEFTNNTQILGISEFGYTCTIEGQTLEADQRTDTKEFGGAHLINMSNNNVTNLRISYSKIPFFLTEMFTTFSELRAIEINSGGLEEIRSDDFLNAGNLESIYMQYNNIKVLNGGIFAGLSRLQKLSLSKNEIERVDGNAFSGLTALRVLYLQENRIRRLNSNTLNSLSLLLDLNLSQNYLTRIPGLLFFHNRNIGVIMLAANQISAIDESFLGNLPRLAVLNLINNRCVNALLDGNRNRINEELRQCYEEYKNLLPDGTRQVIMEIDGEVGLTDSDGRRIIEL